MVETAQRAAEGDRCLHRADTELLYNQPYEDNKKIQVTGPFTVESLSPQPSPEGRGGRIKRVAVCIDPEHGTVSPDLIKDAAKEAVQGIGFDLLVVLGFAFDPHVSEEIKHYGKLTVLPARMNPDLQMGNLLL
jgi:adenine-specific DNA-methyltransferase